MKRCAGCEKRAEYIRLATEAFKAWMKNPVGLPPNPLNLPPESPPPVVGTPHSAALGTYQKEQDKQKEQKIK